MSETDNMENAQPAAASAVLVVALLLTGWGVSDLVRGEAFLFAGGLGSRGAYVPPSVCTGPITPEEHPFLFWGSVGGRVSLGALGVLRCGYILFWPRRKNGGSSKERRNGNPGLGA